jgi:D-sedoheptulose 7-phosphate isomerase
MLIAAAALPYTQMPEPHQLRSHLDEHIRVAQQVAATLSPRIEQVAGVLREAFAAGRRLYTFGNGGSAADAMHFAEELIGRYRRERRPLPAVALTADSTALTCIANDYGFENVFARQVAALAEPGDVVVALTTSGNSENVVRGLAAANEKGATTVLLSAGAGGRCAPLARHAILIPSNITAHIQEMHIVVIHLLCDRMDDWLLGAVNT